MDHLAQETSCSVEMFDPFRSLEINEKEHDLDYLKRIAPQASICMGLATRKVDDK